MFTFYVNAFLIIPGSWHPVSAEKLFFLSLSDGTDKDIFMEGVLTLPGVSNFNC
jgi:hypothetical protein